MNSNLKLLPAALLVAMLALAGCGGGSDDTPVEPPVDTTPPPDPGPTDLERSASAKDVALAARKMAMTLLTDAETASTSISTSKVDGDSRMAERNANTVLAAPALVMAEEAKAAAAVQTLEGIDTASLSAEQMKSVAADLKAAQDALAEIKAILPKVQVLVVSLMGTSTDESKVAMSRNNAVATAIKAAISGTGLSATTTFATNFASVNYDLVPGTSSLMRVGTPGRTFREINDDSDTIRAKDASTTTFTVPAGVTEIVIGTDQSGAWKGIPGVLTCVSTVNCAIESGVIRGTVHFVPSDPAQFYAPTDDGTGYQVANNGAVYGYWLDGTSIAHHAATRSDVTQGSSTNDDGLNWTRDDLGADGNVAVQHNTDRTASYDGMAAGFSERTTDGNHSSGHFVADASLKATFGDSTANTAISGTIRNFAAKDGSAGTGHVNSNWVVALSPRASTNGNFTDGAIDADHEYRSGEVGATAGAWSANAYGAALKRPSGFVGAFNAAFTDGSAAGVYHVEE